MSLWREEVQEVALDLMQGFCEFLVLHDGEWGEVGMMHGYPLWRLGE